IAPRERGELPRDDVDLKRVRRTPVERVEIRIAQPLEREQGVRPAHFAAERRLELRGGRAFELQDRVDVAIPCRRRGTGRRAAAAPVQEVEDNAGQLDGRETQLRLL